MPRRNLARRSDIGPDVLRQRRDLYAFALGLILFNLAGGAFGDSGSSAVLVPIKFADPSVLHAAAWVGLLYFWWRFWLVSEESGPAAFLRDVCVQAADTRPLKAIAIRYVDIEDPPSRESYIRMMKAEPGANPHIRIGPSGLELDLKQLEYRELSPRGELITRHIADYGPANAPLAPAERRSLWIQFIRCVPHAVTHERAFTDYLLPHCTAVFAVLLGALRWWLTPEMPPIAL